MGMRLVLQHKFSTDLTATLDYAFGGVLDLARPDVPLSAAQQFIGTQRRHLPSQASSAAPSRALTPAGSPRIAG